MKNIKNLITLLKIILIIGIVGIIALPLFIFFDVPIQVDGTIITDWTPLIISKLIASIISALMFLVGVYVLRVALKDFYKHQLFNEVLRTSFKQLGYIVIIAVVIDVIINWLAESIFNSGIAFHLNVEYLAHAGIALFFFTLSTMIDKAKGIQQENNLTI